VERAGKDERLANLDRLSFQFFGAACGAVFAFSPLTPSFCLFKNLLAAAAYP
jgi:hypothetical protein